MESATFTLPPEAYTYSTPNNVDVNATNSCTIGFIPWNSTDTTVLGTQFFFNYDLFLKYDSGKINFQLGSNAP